MPLFEVAFRETGSRLTANRALLFIAQYGVVREKLGRAATMEEYHGYWGMSSKTAYRQREAYVAAFGDELVDDLWLRIRRRVRTGDLPAALTDALRATDPGIA
jgi:hypothetical protein